MATNLLVRGSKGRSDLLTAAGFHRDNGAGRQLRQPLSQAIPFQLTALGDAALRIHDAHGKNLLREIKTNRVIDSMMTSPSRLIEDCTSIMALRGRSGVAAGEGSLFLLVQGRRFRHAPNAPLTPTLGILDSQTTIHTMYI